MSANRDNAPQSSSGKLELSHLLMPDDKWHYGPAEQPADALLPYREPRCLANGFCRSVAIVPERLHWAQFT